MQLAVGEGAGGHVGALLVLDTPPEFDVAAAGRVLGARVCAVPRLRQRLYRAPPGCGRPYWADDPRFDARSHIRQVRCPPPGDERALLNLAAAELVKPLPSSRPLWSAIFVTGLADGGTGLLVVVNHVLADGVAGLAVLAALLDAPDHSGTDRGLDAADHSGTDRGQGAPDLTRRGQGALHLTGRGQGTIGTADNSKMRDFPVPPPGLRALAADAWAGRARILAPPLGGLRRLRQGLAELGARPPRRLAPTSLNQPTGAQRRLDVVSADLATVREVAHAHGGTVNDLVLGVVAGALADLLASRGELLREVTVSVPVSARRATGTGQLGNQIGVMPVTVPADGDLGARVRRIGVITRQRKSQARGASAALFVPGFRLLARAGVLRWYFDHQRRVHTFVTNLSGPAEPVTFSGAPVRAVIAVPATTGNVTVTIAVLSYAGTVRVTVLSDPARVPDAPVLVAALRRALSAAAVVRDGTLVLPTGTSSAVSSRGGPG